jgi:hypothetical protein
MQFASSLQQPWEFYNMDKLILESVKRWGKHWWLGNGDCTKACGNNEWTQNKQKITKMQSKLP